MIAFDLRDPWSRGELISLCPLADEPLRPGQMPTRGAVPFFVISVRGTEGPALAARPGWLRTEKRDYLTQPPGRGFRVLFFSAGGTAFAVRPRPGEEYTVAPTTDSVH